jgi:hypothetical protein
MCFEHLTQLKCLHYETKTFHACQKMPPSRECRQYKNVVVKVEAYRSCVKCKARLSGILGGACPSLAKE